jgi:site-specific recombinase XerC
MTAAAALDTWNEMGLREDLLQIAASRPTGEREAFVARSWALITRLRAGRSREFYLERVKAELCAPKPARRIRARVAERSPNALPCHWLVADFCIRTGCVHFKVQDRTCLKDRALFERIYGAGATGPRYE